MLRRSLGAVLSLSVLFVGGGSARADDLGLRLGVGARLSAGVGEDIAVGAIGSSVRIGIAFDRVAISAEFVRAFGIGLDVRQQYEAGVAAELRVDDTILGLAIGGGGHGVLLTTCATADLVCEAWSPALSVEARVQYLVPDARGFAIGGFVRTTWIAEQQASLGAYAVWMGLSVSFELFPSSSSRSGSGSGET